MKANQQRPKIIREMFLFELIVVFCLTTDSSYSQDSFNYRNERHLFNVSLILKGSLNKTIKKINDDEEFEGRYLGIFKTKKNRSYYLLNSSYVFDIKTLAKTENQLFIYNRKRQFVGYYYLGQIDELPYRLFNNKVYFKVNDCEEKITVELMKGIPRVINLRCNRENNFYEFQTK